MSAASGFLRSARQIARPLARSVRRHVLPHVLPTSNNAFPRGAERIRVVGLLSSASGLGESARLCVRALTARGYTVSTRDVAGLFESDDGVAFPAGAGDADGPAEVAIYHLNPPMLLPSIVRVGAQRHARTYSIGYWAWELETLPAEWVRALRFVDAVMVPSRFCQTAIQAHTDRPVLVVPHPVAAPEPLEVERPDGFRVLSIFNFGSSYERKNPDAAIEAFRRAFAGEPDAELVLKVSDGARYPAERDRLLARICDLPNVRLIDGVWDDARMRALLASADAYLSLHRSEGFGLTLAEAILAGVPVVATDWSGNTDFCRPDLCYPVAFALKPFHDPHLAYAGMGPARWAEPDVEHAAQQLRRVRAEGEGARAKARALGQVLRAHVRDHGYAEALAGLEAGAAAPAPLAGRAA